MATKKVKTTRLDIIRAAATLIFEQGYSATSPRQICDILDLSTGNITYYFPTKEHLLTEFVHMLCDCQWKVMEAEADEGYSSVMAVCLELTAMAAMCEENEIAKDFYLATYTSPMCLEVIRRNDMERSKLVYKDYCSDWTQEKFVEAETIVSGIEYATLMTTGESASLETRIEGALNNILSIYGVPEEIRQAKIARVLAMDYRKIGRRVFKEFKKYIVETNEKALEELIQSKKQG